MLALLCRGLGKLFTTVLGNSLDIQNGSVCERRAAAGDQELPDLLIVRSNDPGVVAAFDLSITEQQKQGAQRYDARGIVDQLESLAGDGEGPLVLIACDARQGIPKKGEGWYCLRAVEQIICYESAAFTRAEKARLKKEAAQRKLREIEEKRQQRQAVIRAEAARIKAERAAEDEARQGLYAEDQQIMPEREAEQNLISLGLLEPEENASGLEKSPGLFLDAELRKYKSWKAACVGESSLTKRLAKSPPFLRAWRILYTVIPWRKCQGMAGEISLHIC